jgi:hypothetical protein
MSGRSDQRDLPASARHASAAARASAIMGSTSVRPCSTSLTGPGRRHRVRAGTTRTPRPPGPPQDLASPARTSKYSGTGSRPRQAMASTSSGTPWVRHSSCARSRGCRVPISPLAHWTAARTVPGTDSAVLQGLRRSTRPDRSTGTSANSDGSWAAAAWWRPVVRIAECSTALATIRAPRRRAAYRRPASPRAKRCRTGGQERDLSRTDAQSVGENLAGLVQQSPGAATLGCTAVGGPPSPRPGRPSGWPGPPAAWARSRRRAEPEAGVPAHRPTGGCATL